MQFDTEEMKVLIVEKASRSFIEDDDLWEMVKKNLDTRVDKLFAERAAYAVSEAVDAAVRDGFDRAYQPVDSYGTKRGEPTTIRDELNRLVHSYWSERVDKSGRPAVTSQHNAITRAEYLMAQICANDFSEKIVQAAVSVTAALKDGFRVQLAAHVDGLLDELFRVKSLQDQGKAEKPY